MGHFPNDDWVSFRALTPVAILTVANTPPRITYNKFHIALSTTGYKFCWLHPRQTASHCHVEIRIGNEARDAIVQRLGDAGIGASALRRNSIKLKLTAKEVEENEQLLSDVFLQAERWSQTRGGEA